MYVDTCIHTYIHTYRWIDIDADIDTCKDMRVARAGGRGFVQLWTYAVDMLRICRISDVCDVYAPWRARLCMAAEVSHVGAGVSYIVTEVSRVGCVGHGPRFYLYLCMYLCMYLCTCLCMYLSVPLQQRCLVSVASDTARGFTCIYVCICGWIYACIYLYLCN